MDDKLLLELNDIIYKLEELSIMMKSFINKHNKVKNIKQSNHIIRKNGICTCNLSTGICSEHGVNKVY